MGGSELKSMSRGTQGVRFACAIWAVLLASWLLASCDAFDSGMLLPLPGGNGGAGGSPDAGGGGGDIDAGPCVPTAEACNGVDDDCDDVADPGDPEADAYCDATFHAESSCTPVTSGGAQCVRIGACAEGYLNCDGLPSNGCEFNGSACMCLICEDAGDDDSGLLP
jgi:hypothetical protein